MQPCFYIKAKTSPPPKKNHTTNNVLYIFQHQRITQQKILYSSNRENACLPPNTLYTYFYVVLCYIFKCIYRLIVIIFVEKNNDFSDGGNLVHNAVQLKPQRIKIKLIPSK